MPKLNPVFAEVGLTIARQPFFKYLPFFGFQDNTGNKQRAIRPVREAMVDSGTKEYGKLDRS
jgi:hypothetical protein